MNPTEYLKVYNLSYIRDEPTRKHSIMNLNQME